jgi:hypothetical protein
MKIYMIFDVNTGKERVVYGKQTRFFVCKRQAEATAKRYKHLADKYVVREFDLVEVF